MKEMYKVGDKVRHGNRKSYQNCVVTEVEEGCNSLIKILCEDGFYGFKDESQFPVQDLIKVKTNNI